MFCQNTSVVSIDDVAGKMWGSTLDYVGSRSTALVANTLVISVAGNQAEPHKKVGHYC